MSMLTEPVPLTLLCYLVFTVGRLYLAYRGTLPRPLLVLSIFVDIGLLLWLIWSFHEQYQQPAAFSLKVPTFTYVFVFIALRALCFDYRLVLTVGVAAAAGWAGMLLLVLAQNEPSIITRSFVSYLGGNKVLLGAEFDKIFTMILVAGVLALAVKRGRDVMITAVHEQATGRDIRRFMADDVAKAIANSEQVVEAGQAVERQAAIMMLDIRGFTALSKEVPPREIVNILTSLHARLIPIIEGHGGVVDKFLGDGMMATFGAVEPSNKAVADGLRAMEAVMIEASAWQKDLKQASAPMSLDVNGALTAGTIVFATIGNADRLEYTVIGEAVNLAAKLEKHNKVEGTRALMPAAAYAVARSQGYLGSSGSADEPELLLMRRPSGVSDSLDICVICK
ncbi:MAG: adenylate/guanylate cyclase domain-containing protein [Hyphomicrobiaceae bacterium]